MGLLAGTIFDRPPHCDRCDLPETECRCTAPVAKSNLVPPGRQTARLSTEKRKKGKLVTLIQGLAATDNDFPALLTQLKNSCGAGGAIDGDCLEIQGDQVERVKKFLGQLGYKVR
jgi:translation initiation factor 1